MTFFGLNLDSHSQLNERPKCYLK